MVEQILMYYLAFLAIVAVTVIAISRIKDNENDI
jgi:hypothetical protein